MIFVVAVNPKELDLCFLCEFRYTVHELLPEGTVYPISEVAYRDDVRYFVLFCVRDYPLGVSYVAMDVACEHYDLFGLFSVF
jgi:hypothetical protein